MSPNEKVLKMSGTMAVHVRYNSLYISFPSSANNNVKCIFLHILEKGGYYGKFFVFLSGIDRWHYIFRFSRFSDRSSTEQIEIVTKFKGKN